MVVFLLLLFVLFSSLVVFVVLNFFLSISYGPYAHSFSVDLWFSLRDRNRALKLNCGKKGAFVTVATL